MMISATMRRAVTIQPQAIRSLSGVSQTPSKLPDFNTSVDTKSHSLGVSPAQRARKLRRKLLKEQKEANTGEATSLVEETLAHMQVDEEFQLSAKRLKEFGQKHLTKQEHQERRRALDAIGVPSFDEFLKNENVELLQRVPTDLFQINIGRYCNQACAHCHVESSPRRINEQMTRETVDQCLKIIANSPTVKTVDITGGAPELNGEFRYLVTEARKLGKEVIDRCNLTVLLEPGQEDLVEFLAENKVQVVASLPCYGEENVNQQRGNGVFDRSIAGLQKLNEAGYGMPDSGLQLDLVYNPLGGFLPPPQGPLEIKYKEELSDQFGIEFNNLFCITNMPIKRFADFLSRRGELQAYMELLVRNFNPDACNNVMCTSYLSVDYRGIVYDCDFNQQLDMSFDALEMTSSASADGKEEKLLMDDIAAAGGGGNMSSKEVKKLSVFDIKCTDDMMPLKIKTANHCFGCVSGMGSSCQGTTA